LITVRGAEVLARADVVVHDRLAESSLLALAPAAAEVIDVGKRPGAPVPQDEINALLVAHAKAGRTVVRLKGGDPFVFGRGGEEAEALLAAGVDFEVVPGVTSAVAAPAYAGVPVTHRGLATSFTVVTGHSRHAVDEETNWEALAAAGGTIVVLMGVAHRAEIAARLIAGGLDASTPVMAIYWGTRPAQRSARTTLGALGATALEPPAVIVIGRVAGLDLAWFERRPLLGRRVVVTRAADQVGALSARLAELGADVIELPTIAIAEPADGGAALRDAAARVGRYDWLAFTSANAIRRFMAMIRPDARALGGVRIAAIGSATAEALAEFGLRPDIVGAPATAEGLLAAFPSGPGRVLLPRAAVGRDVLPVGLRSKGFVVDVVEAYRTVRAVLEPGAAAEAAKADAVLFTSASTVANYTAPVPPVVACIGPVTAAAAAEAGIAVDVVGSSASMVALVEALVRQLGSRS